MLAPTLVQGIPVPTLLYGTAWKEEETARLTGLALTQGFRGIDTANQRRHYFEAAVGEAIAQAFKTGVVRRQDLFLQTKFTSVDGQDQRLPYDRTAPLATQVEQSFQSSLEHLGVEQLDSYVLHGPTVRHGLADEDWEIWTAMEALHRAQKTRLLGISNVSAEQLKELCDHASVKPAMVQNRCYASRGWDRAVRLLCVERGIVYQGFSLLTANREVVGHKLVKTLAAKYSKTPAQVVFRFATQLPMIALTGTSSASHMTEDLSSGDFSLAGDEVAALERVQT